MSVLPLPPPEMKYLAPGYICQPPNWRWERARMLREDGKYARKNRDDEWVRLAMKFQSKLCGLTSIAGHERLYEEMPGLYAAWHMYAQTEDSGKNNRWGIEAYLCANEAPEDVAKRLGIAPEVVVCFTKMFFDVVGKTRNGLYMLNEVIGRSVHRGIAAREYDLLWKIFGMAGGPRTVSAIMNCNTQPEVIPDNDQATGVRLAEMLKETAVARSLVAIRTIPIEYNQEVIFNFCTKLLEIGQKADGIGEAKNMIMTNVNAMMVNMGFEFGGKPEREPDHPLGAYDSQSAELRAGEQVRLALGPAKLDDPFQGFKFPEAKDGSAKR